MPKTNGVPLDPAAEREQMRQLTREMHEAAQAAKDGAKELRAAQNEIDARVSEHVTELMNQATSAWQEHFDDSISRTNTLISKGESQTRAHFTEMLGTSGATLILQICAMVLHLATDNITVAGWIAEIQKGLDTHQVNGCDCTGCLTVRLANVASPTGPPVGLLCPGCQQPAAMLMDSGQAFCDTVECRIFMWDPNKTMAENLSNGRKMELPG